MNIPGKTFILGEYAALQAYPAILLTTTPCFKVTASGSLLGIHPDSPAGKLAQDEGIKIKFYDPHQGIGGLGASSAQFLGVYQKVCEKKKRAFNTEELLHIYYYYAWNGIGSKPSGYDLLAQNSQQCVYIQNKQATSFAWPFTGLTFILVHTKIKCATHTHLNAVNLPDSLELLGNIVEEAWKACKFASESRWIDTISIYHEALLAYHWVSESSLALQNKLKKYPGVKALKGCGALGTDVIFILLERDGLDDCLAVLKKNKHYILATESSLFKGK